VFAHILTTCTRQLSQILVIVCCLYNHCFTRCSMPSRCVVTGCSNTPWESGFRELGWSCFIAPVFY